MQQILSPGLDPTAYASLSGAQLLQLVAQATFAPSIGGNILTVDDNSGNPNIPDGDANSQYQTFTWLRVGNPASSGNVITPYVWNPNQARGALYRWQQIQQSSIGASSILGYMIAPATIDKTKISGLLDPSQISGLSPLSQFLTINSIPGGSALTGSWSSLILAINAINNVNQFQAGVIDTNAPFSGQCIDILNVMTNRASANSQVLMAPLGAGGLPAWVSKAILTMAEPNSSTQEGYIPVVASDGSGTVNWVAPTAAFPAGAISCSAEIYAGAITVTSLSATTNVWTINTANTGTLANGQYVTMAGFGTKYTNLNGTWVVSSLVTNVSFQVTSTGNISGSGTTTIGSCHFCNLASTALNVDHVVYNSIGNYTVYYTTPKGSAAYVALASALSTAGANNNLLASIISKATGSITVQIENGSSGALIDNTDVSLIVL